MKKLLTILGTRPQYVKAAVVSRALCARPGVKEILADTGQHYDFNLSGLFCLELGLPVPQHRMGVAGGTHGIQTGLMLQALDPVLASEQPDGVLVYGDTNSTLAGALAAAKMRIPIAHVEAGLRSFNRNQPEEVNRKVTDHLSDRLYAPTPNAAANLMREGMRTDQVLMSGDVMLDAAQFYSRLIDKDPSNRLTPFGVQPRQYVLATIHRAENTDDPVRLRRIVRQLTELSLTCPVHWPVHPRTLAACSEANISWPVCLRSMEPVGYLDMLALERSALAIVTDSGGVQKEAFFHHVPCITLRQETEWVELVNGGYNTLAGGDAKLSELLRQMLARNPDWSAQLFGSGHAADVIAADLERFLGATS